MKLLSRLRLRTKLMLLMGLSVLALVASNAVSSSVLRARMTEDRIDKLHAVTDTAMGLAQALENEVTAHRLTHEQALERFRDAAHAIRFDDGFGYIVGQTLDSMVLVHGANPKLENVPSSAKTPDGKSLTSLIVDTLRNADQGFVAYAFAKPGQQLPQPKVAYVARFKPWDMVFVIGAYTDDLDAAFRATLWNLVLVGGAILLVTLIAAWLINHDITGSLGRLKTAMAHLAKDELTIDIPGTDRRDEVGEMAAAAMVFRQHMRHERELGLEQEQERERAEAAKHTALIQMAETIEAEARDAMRQVGILTTAMAENAKNMSGSASRTGSAAQGAADASSQAQANVQMVASAAEQLAASIREIGSQMGQSTAVVARAVEAGRLTRQTMEALNEQVTRISTVADMIGEIAARTNLLALNATIEAARAGDAGKGFAVVASEVKQLATQSARSTQEIARHIAEVRTATSASVAAVGQIEATITEVNAIASSIAASVEEQGAATAEIARNVTETAAAALAMTDRSSEVAAEAEQTGKQAAEVLENVKGLDLAVHDLQRSVVRVVRTATADADRRSGRRRPCLVEATIQHGGQSIVASLHDISETGCYAVTKSQLPVGQTIALELTRLGKRLSGTAVSQNQDGAHIKFTGEGLRSDEADKISLATIAEVVKLTKADHVAFVKRVVDAVATGEKSQSSTLASHHDCRLGRWYDSVTDPMTTRLASFRAIIEPHQAVHECGRQAMVALVAGDLSTARSRIADMQARSEQVMHCLDEFGREYPSTIPSPQQNATLRAAA